MRAYVIAFTSLIALAATATPAAAQQGQFRAEIHAGWDHSRADGIADDDFDDSGFLYGVGLGYDLNVGKNAFVGIDLSADDSTMKECRTSALLANDELCLRAGRDLAAGIRAGFNVSERGKVYGLAGYTNARFKTTYTTPAGITTTDAENLDGFRLGAGYQHALSGNTYGKVEYRYSNYEHDVTRHQVLFGLGLTF
jgi:outer membrane immunogenic protein